MIAACCGQSKGVLTFDPIAVNGLEVFFTSRLQRMPVLKPMAVHLDGEAASSPNTVCEEALTGVDTEREIRFGLGTVREVLFDGSSGPWGTLSILTNKEDIVSN